MYCNRCGSVKHFAANCPGPNVHVGPVTDPVVFDREPVDVPIDACSVCGSTAQTFADARRWSVIREKQRARMAKKRKK